MTDVVGLRFVSEGYDQVNLQIRDYLRSLKQTTDTIAQAARGADAAASQYLKQVDAYKNSAAALDRLNQMQRDSARAAQEIVNRAAGVTNAYKSAAESAKTFGEMLRRQDAVAREWGQGLDTRLGVAGQRATELGATFGRLSEVQRNLDTTARAWTEGVDTRLGVAGQRATELGATFGRLGEVQRNLDASARLWTDSLNQNLGVTGQRATELGATFGRLAEVQRTLEAGAQAWTATLNERLGVTGQRATELGATFARLAEIQRNIETAARAWTATLNQNLGVTGQRATELGATFERLSEVQRRLDAASRAWTTALNERLGVSGQRATELGATFSALEARQRGVAQSYDQLRAAIDPVIAAQQRYADAERRVNAAVQQGIVTREQGNATLAAYRLRLNDLGRTALDTETMTGRLRTQFLATANSIAILDGPLGGVASRFSAFGILIGRTGLLIGTALVGFATFGAVLNRGIRNLIEWEAQTARINAVLTVTRGQVGLTAGEIERLASSIALNTLETEQGVRAAAARLLTFRDIAGDVFEDVLKSATDMAALGFGTVESESTKLAKALEDPAQALTSLSRAGIVFTRQQRQVIISLVESGRRAEAMDRILQNVRARTQGAAEAAAAGTLAGAFDTIGQAVSRATRDFAQWTLTITGARAAIEAIASGVSDYAAGQKGTAEQIRETEAAVKGLREEMERAQEVANRPAVRAFGTAAMGRGERLPRAVQAELDVEERRLAALREQLDIERRLARISPVTAQVARDTEGLDNLRTELDLRRAALGLGEDQARVQRMLAQEGLRNVDVEARLNALVERRNDLLAQGVDPGLIQVVMDRYRQTLESVAETAQELVTLAQQERDVRSAMAASQDLQQRNSLLQAQAVYLQQGMDLTQARAQAEDDATRAMLDSVIAAGNLPPEVEASLRLTRELVGQVRSLENAFNWAAAAAGRIAGALSGAAAQLRGMLIDLRAAETQNALLARGVDPLTARARSETQAFRSRLIEDAGGGGGALLTRNQQVELEGKVNQFYETRLRLLQEGERYTNLTRGAAGGGGGGGGSAQELATLESIGAEMLQRIERERTLLNLQGQARIEQEIYFDLIDQLAQKEIPYREANVRAMAAQIAAEQQINQELAQREKLTERIGQAFGNLFMAATEGADAFRSALSGVLKNLASMLANAAFTQLFKSSGSGIFGAIGSLFNALVPSAKGNVFTGGNLVPFAQGAVIANMNRAPGANVIPFANGGVVNRPTTFPMRGGQTGLMGEAGPEAIMPLRRGRDGKLGVAAQAQAAPVDVRVYVDENGNWQAAVERIADKRVQRQGPTLVRQSVQAVYAANSERKLK
jgi:hypothetical protein